MKMPLFYDVHTHFSVENGIANRYWSGEAPASLWYSAGFHPWYLPSDNWGEALDWLAETTAQAECVAIGEAGLDKLTTTHWNLQMKAFEICVDRAIAQNKPLILHCVRAFDEILSVKKRFGSAAENIPWIFHGFNKKAAIAEHLLNAGAYLSFGAALLNPRFSARSAFEVCPTDRCFFETDDQAATGIRQIYAAAAEIKGLSLLNLAEQVESSFLQIFKTSTNGFLHSTA